MASRPIDATAELQRSLDLLTKNWVLAIPSALAALLFAIFVTVGILSALAGLGTAAILSGGRDLHQAVAKIIAVMSSGTFLIGLPVLAILDVVAHVMTLAAAQDAWEGRPPDFGRAFSLTLGRFPALLIAGILIALLAIIPAVLSFLLVGLPLLLALFFFTMYVTAAIVLGGRSGSAAIAESYRLVRANPGASAIAFFAFIVVAIIGQIANSLVAHVPPINFLAAFAIGGFTTAFSAVVSARFYDLLSGRAAAPAFAGGPQPPAPPPGSSIVRG
jgi:hypothetical protein